MTNNTSKRFADQDWTESESIRQECNHHHHHHRGKHIWMYSTFCDRGCEIDFDEWLQEEKEKVVFDLVCNDFNRMLYRMSEKEEGKIDTSTSVYIYTQMKELARAKGFLKLPWEKT